PPRIVSMSMGSNRRSAGRSCRGKTRLTQGGKLVGVGLIMGLAATLAASRAMGSMLFNISAQDPLTLASTTLLLAAVALVACILPGRCPHPRAGDWCEHRHLQRSQRGAAQAAALPRTRGTRGHRRRRPEGNSLASQALLVMLSGLRRFSGTEP